MKSFLNWFLFLGTMFAAGSSPLGGGGADTGGNSGGTGGNAPAGDSGQPAASGGTPAAGTGQVLTPAQAPAELRAAYDALKAKYEPYEKLGVQPDQIGQFQGVYQKTYTEVANLGRGLGYEDDEIAEALATDPVKCLDFLRAEAQRMQQGGQERGGDRDLEELVNQHVQQALGPIQQRENVRMTDAANNLFESTARSEIAAIYKSEGIDVANIPQDEMFMLVSAASEILKYDEEAIHALKFEGKTAPIQKAVREAATFLDKYYLARSGRSRQQIVPARPGQPAAQPGNKKFSLDDMIENPSVIDEAQGRSGATGRYQAR